MHDGGTKAKELDGESLSLPTMVRRCPQASLSYRRLVGQDGKTASCVSKDERMIALRQFRRESDSEALRI